MASSVIRREAVLRALRVRKIHLRKHVLARVPEAVAREFRHAWAPVDALVGYFGLFPDQLLHFWAEHPAGHVVITEGEAGYVPGTVHEGRRVLQGVAFIPVTSLVGEGEHPLLFVAHVLDHLLGCNGAVDGMWLSEGGGYTELWQEVGQRLQRQFALGYASTEAARTDPRRYFAEGLVAYWRDRVGLRVQDPGLEAIFRTTVLSPAFWQRVGV